MTHLGCPKRGDRGTGVVVALVLGLVLSACGIGTGGDDQAIPDDCTVVDAAVSSEKIDLLTELARTFNDSDEASEGGCTFVRVQSKASGGAEQLLEQGWPDEGVNGPKPVIWSPAGSAWGGVLNHRLSEQGEPAMVSSEAEPFMLTPLVIAMPEPMARVLGWPDEPIGYADLLALAQDPAGWASKGKPEWGPFRLGKTNPNYSTSALNATIAQYYAATGKTSDLTLEDINRPEVEEFARGVESAVVHYGDITMTFLNNWFRNDVRGTSLTYVSAVAVEEKSVIDYNQGNPDGVLEPGERPRKPRVPLVAIYPEEGTLFSDNPFFILDAEWVDDDEERGARAFQEFVQRPENQRKVLEFGFRPGNPRVEVGRPIVAANGVDPDQPQTTLGVPEPAVLAGVIDKWAEQRKAARVLVVLDVSGSMGDPGEGNATKLDLAKQAAIDALEQFKSQDEVGLRLFTTNIGPPEHPDWVDVVPIGPIAEQRELMRTKIRDLIPLEGTPLYTTAVDAYEHMRDQYDPARINAVVLLTDGRNEDRRNDDIEGTIQALRAGSEGQSSTPVRMFTIAYGEDADTGPLLRMAEATNAAAYNAQDPGTIDRVFTAVISNF
jgi:Ca-activated chloride channel family protein